MAENLCIRSAALADANAISRLIIQTLIEVNTKDYPDSVIREVIQNFSEEKIIERMKLRRIFVITNRENIIGTASLEGTLVKTVFVLPSEQGKNIGSLLMNHLENIARKEHIDSLTVQSSLTAEGFYRKIRYKVLRNEYYGKEKTIIMEKSLNYP